MAARRSVKTFTTSKEGKTKKEPIVFELEGETFEAYGEVPGAVLLDFIAKSSTEDSAGTAEAIQGYLKASMDKASYRRFDKLTRDPEVLIELSTLADIVSYLIEERTDDRPTP